MNWEAIAAISEVIGIVFVVFSLMYVATEVRQNTNALRSSANAAAISSIRDWNRDLIANTNLTKIFRKGVEDMSALNEDELSQFIMVMQNMMKTFEDMHYNYKKQIMDPSIWKGWENLGRIYFTSPGVRQYWSERYQIYSIEFQEWVTSLKADPSVKRMDDLAKSANS